MRRYEKTRDELVARLLIIENAIGEDRRGAIARTRARLERGKFVLAVVGEFSSGKSFLLNAMLKKTRRAFFDNEFASRSRRGDADLQLRGTCS